MELDLIFTKDDLIVSKRHFDWKTWQDKFANYKASLSFQNTQDLVEWLSFEYHPNISVENFAAELEKNDAELLILDFDKLQKGLVTFKGL